MKIQILKRTTTSTWKKDEYNREKSETQDVEIASFELGIKETNSFLSMFDKNNSMGLREDGNIELEDFIEFSGQGEKDGVLTSVENSMVIRITK